MVSDQFLSFSVDSDPECDIPVPGIPGPGNCAPFWMVPVPVLEKIGPGKKCRYRYLKNLVPEKSTGPGTGKKYGYRYRKNLVPEKSTGLGTGKNSGYRHTLICPWILNSDIFGGVELKIQNCDDCDEHGGGRYTMYIIHRLPLDEHDRACGVFGQPLDRSDQ